jgi:hypothetical protein
LPGYLPLNAITDYVMFYVCRKKKGEKGKGKDGKGAKESESTSGDIEVMRDPVKEAELSLMQRYVTLPCAFEFEFEFLVQGQTTHVWL